MKANRRRIAHLIAAAALFGLPGCRSILGLQTPTLINFNPGPTPQSSVMFCDIEKVGQGWDNTSRVCADNAPGYVRTIAVPLTSAALALNTSQTSPFALDKSDAAVGRCGADGEIVEFNGPFPQGNSACLNCDTQIGLTKTYHDANDACVARCKDVSLIAASDLGLSTTDIDTFCNNHALASTNVPVIGCPLGFDGACTEAGTLGTNFTDPRLFPEPVSWTDLIGVATSGSASNDLTRTAANDGASDAGADSLQVVAGGDAYVEFSASDTTHNDTVGFSEPSCTLPCADTDPSPADITYQMKLSADGNIRILQHGTPIVGPDVKGTWGPYQAGDRFRVTVLDRGDGHFDVQWSRLLSACSPGSLCNEQVLTTFTAGDAYPVRVDTSLDAQGSTLQNVLLMRIIPQ